LRIAWFSPLPPTRSGIAAYSAEVLPLLEAVHVIDAYPESRAHDFVWTHRLRPYDLVVYHLGNAPCHDYMWAYLVRYPGLAVLHDARLHHARARHLLKQERADDYRREFAFDHPDARPDFAEYAVAGLGGPIYYFWSMLRVIMRTARLVAVHSSTVAADLVAEYAVSVDTIRMGVPPLPLDPAQRSATRRALSIPDEAIVFAAFGKVTAEKRVTAMLNATAALAAERNTFLMLVGDASEYAGLTDQVAAAGIADRVRVTGHVESKAIGAHLAAADACLCLRWPTALESSASWLRCLAARRATVITDLAHLADIPQSAALRVEVLDEDRGLAAAMRALSADGALRQRVAEAGHAFWASGHTLEAMAADYARVLVTAASRPTTERSDVPSHFAEDFSENARRILRGARAG
jgi:glycosyltransferase involved in cell wall biosynthesis